MKSSTAGGTEAQKRRQEEAEAARAFAEYIETFQETPGTKAPSRTWIKAGVYESGKKHEEKKPEVYKPVSRFEKPSRDDEKPSIPSRPDKPGSKAKKEKEKKKSNLEIFKDELKLIQEEREERHRLKTVLGFQDNIKLPPKPGDDLRASLSLEIDDIKMGSIDDGDPNTTNIYLGNLPTKISELQLMELFGSFGPLASVKVMWPRTEEEKTRNRLSGFVAYMSRKDGERALKHLCGREILGSTEVKLGWGKAVPIPSWPVYIPPELMKLTMPPPLSGLPFNAQPRDKDKPKVPPPGTPYPSLENAEEYKVFSNVLYHGTIKVVTPTDRTLLALIHRMVEFVAREGPMFEAMVMNREIANPAYRFLFENQSPAHIYYRWKLFSVLQGDSVGKWRAEDFRMFKGGSIWKPPTMNPFTQGMPNELIPEEDREISKGSLSNAQRNRLEHMIRHLTPARHRIAELMIFTIEHSESSNEITNIFKESLTNPRTSLIKKVSRLYALSDILYNSIVNNNSSRRRSLHSNCYKKHIKAILPEVFQGLSSSISGNIGNEDNIPKPTASSKDCYKQRVTAVFKAWEEWDVFEKDFLIKLQNIFLGLVSSTKTEFNESTAQNWENNAENGTSTTDALSLPAVPKRPKSHIPATKQTKLPPSSAINLIKAMQSIDPMNSVPVDEDLDGVEMIDEPEEDKPKAPEKLVTGTFKPSKWETIDPEEVKAQAVTTSKWELLASEASTSEEQEFRAPVTIPNPSLVSSDYMGGAEEDIDGVPMEDEDDYYDNTSFMNTSAIIDDKTRDKLREIENKVLEYQDELEEKNRRRENNGAGITSRNIQVAVEEFRKSLMKKLKKENASSNYEDYGHESLSNSSPESTSTRGSHRRSSHRRENRDRSRSERSNNYDDDDDYYSGRDRDTKRRERDETGSRRDKDYRKDKNSRDFDNADEDRDRRRKDHESRNRDRSRSRERDRGDRDRLTKNYQSFRNSEGSNSNERKDPGGRERDREDSRYNRR